MNVFLKETLTPNGMEHMVVSLLSQTSKEILRILSFFMLIDIRVLLMVISMRRNPLCKMSAFLMLNDRQRSFSVKHGCKYCFLLKHKRYSIIMESNTNHKSRILSMRCMDFAFRFVIVH